MNQKDQLVIDSRYKYCPISHYFTIAVALAQKKIKNKKIRTILIALFLQRSIPKLRILIYKYQILTQLKYNFFRP